MNLAFGKNNYLIIALGIGLAIWGMYLLSLPPVDNALSLNVAPIVLALAYLVIIPIGILFPSKVVEKAEKSVGQIGAAMSLKKPEEKIEKSSGHAARS